MCHVSAVPAVFGWRQHGSLASGIAARAQQHASRVPGQSAAGGLAGRAAPAQLRLAVQAWSMQVHTMSRLAVKVDDSMLNCI